MDSSLNARQEAFCRHYVLGTSAAAAARQAGYSAPTARSQAWRLLQHPDVQARIAALRADRETAAAALCGQLWEQVEAIRAAALAKGQYGAALRAVTTQLRLFERLGLPATAADTLDVLVEGAAAETGLALTDVDIGEQDDAARPPASDSHGSEGVVDEAMATLDDATQLAADAVAPGADAADPITRAPELTDVDETPATQASEEAAEPGSDNAERDGDDTEKTADMDPQAAAVLRAALTEMLGGLGQGNAAVIDSPGKVLPFRDRPRAAFSPSPVRQRPGMPPCDANAAF